MSKARLVITAIEIEGRGVAEVARSYGISRSWIYELLARYRAEGEAAFEPRSRRPHTSPAATPPSTVDLIIQIRKQLSESGMDAGPDTIAWHLEHRHQTTVSVSTVARTLVRQGLIQPEPNKRPKSSYIRFEAAMPNQTWQSDFTHYRLTTGADTEIITWLDDHSRYALHVSAHTRITASIVLTTFRETAAQHGHPGSVLTDNGMVYTVRFASKPGGRTALESELQRLNIMQKNSRPQPPNHLRKSRTFPADDEELAHRPTPPTSQHHRTTDPDRHLRRDLQHHPPTPLAHTPGNPGHRLPHPPESRPQRRPQHRHPPASPQRQIDHDGKLSLRLNGTMHHIGIGAEHARTQVLKLVDGYHIRVINAATGELLRELTIDPARNYQPLGRPPGPKPKHKNPDPNSGSGPSGMS